MTGKSHRIDQNNGDDVQMKDEKLDKANKDMTLWVHKKAGE